MLFVLGPGHGAPGILSSLYLEGAISRFYSHCSADAKGLEALIREFSWPGTFVPSHVNAYTPGAIHEGGELGYSLSVSYGSVMDKKDLVTVCLVGDGEAETGPMSAAWHGHKVISKRTSNHLSEAEVYD
jgi:xylulose-5-phosphate/fructose-6-phosphate phosphoketolase